MSGGATAINSTAGWQAKLALSFVRRETGTVLERREHRGPLLVQRAFYPEPDGTCHCYVLHPPGGVVGGDQLRIDVDLDAGSDAVITTPAAGKYYRSAGATAELVQCLRVASGATLEWLPQESIVFEGARICTQTRVDLIGDAGFIGWEIVCLGRPAAGEAFLRGACHLGFEIHRDGLPLFLEQNRYRGSSEPLAAKWGLQGYPVTGTMVCVTRGCSAVETLQDLAAENGQDELFSASQLDEVLICRYLGGSAERARTLFTIAWSHVRRSVLGKAPVLPRIWNT